jgi:hypothetical protein
VTLRMQMALSRAGLLRTPACGLQRGGWPRMQEQVESAQALVAADTCDDNRLVPR